MKTALFTRITYLLLVCILLTAVVTNLSSVNAIGLGITDHAPIMGVTCGNPYAKDEAGRMCCNLPGEKDKPFARGQLQMFTGDLNAPAPKEPEKSQSIWKKGLGFAGKLIQRSGAVGSIPLNGGGLVSEFAKGIFEVFVKSGMPIMTGIMQKHTSALEGSLVEKSTALIDKTGAGYNAETQRGAVDYRCDRWEGFAVKEGDPDTGKCVCIPYGKENMVPNSQTFVDWPKWIASHTPPENMHYYANVLGSSTLAQGTNLTDEERVDLIYKCAEGNASDDYARMVCMRQAFELKAKFMSKCNAIKDPKEKEQCKLCIQGGANSYTDKGWGENISGVWTGLGCIPTDYSKVIGSTLLPWSIGIGGGVAMLVLMYAGFLFTISRGNPDKLKKARDYMNSGLIGLLVIIFSVFIPPQHR